MVGAFLPEISHPALNAERSALLRAFEATGRNMKRDGGVDLLPAAEQDACRSFFANLAEYGIFVVPTGEVESWLRDLAISRNKETWLKTVFEAMGDDPTVSTYVRPASGDVWDFIGSIARWVIEPKRKGVPD